MNKKIFAILFCILLLPGPVLALKIEVNVKGKIGGHIEYFEMEKKVDSVQNFLVQWYNTESVSCVSRIEFKVEGKNYSESVWSEAKDMLPGISDYFEGYWIPPQKGNYTVKIIVHHCHQVIESDPINFSVYSLPQPKKTIEIEAKNLPGRKIQIRLKSEKDLKNVVVIPSNYPIGWIFNGRKIENLKAGETTIELDYEPSVWREEPVSFQAISLDGSYASNKTILILKEEKTFWEMHGYNLFLLAVLLLILSIVFNIYLVKTRKPKHRKL